MIIQGFGQVGSGVARLIEGLGCTVVGISDVHARVYNPGGINASKAMDHTNREGSLIGFAFDAG